MNIRLKIFNLLTSMKPEAFDVLAEMVNVPPGMIPPASAAQGMRVSPFLQWWEGPTGLGQPIEALEPLARISKIIYFLYGLPTPQFEQIVFTFDVGSYLPGKTSPQCDRAKALVNTLYGKGKIEELVEVIYVLTGFEL